MVGLAFVATAAVAGVTGEWRVNLLKSGTTQSTVTGATQEAAWAACQSKIPAGTAGTYTCQTPRYVATVTVDTPTCTTPQPSNESTTNVCPTGTTGSWTQTRSYSAAPYPTCWTAGAWTPSTAPAGACTTVVEPPPPPPPPPSTSFTPDAGFALSGKAALGEVLTITGAGFGAHADNNAYGGTWQGKRYLAFLVQDFSAGYATNGLRYGENTGAKWEVVSMGCPSNTAKCARWYYGSSRQGELQISPKTNPDTLYSSFKLRVGKLDAKIWRLWWSGGDAYLSTGGTNNQVRGGNTLADDVYGSANSFRSGWNRVETIVYLKSPVSFTPYLNGVKQWSKPWPQNQPASLSGHTIDYGNLLESGNEAWFADLYLDFTLVRCELADGATWAARTKSEVQVPLTWSDTRVQIGYSPGEVGTGYLYCFDAKGAPTRIGKFN